MFYRKYVLLQLLILVVGQFLLSGCDGSTNPNNNPVVNSIAAFPDHVEVADSFAVFCSAFDPDGDPLTYDWTCTNGGASIKGTSPDDPFKLLNTKDNMMIFYAKDLGNFQYGHAAIFCDVHDSKDGLKTVWVQVGISR